MFRERDAPARPHFLAILQFLAEQQDVAVEPRIADHGIGRAAADRRVEFVAANREIILVEPVAMGEAQEIPVRNRRSSDDVRRAVGQARSEEHTSELQSLMRISYAVFGLKKQNQPKHTDNK